MKLLTLLSIFVFLSQQAHLRAEALIARDGVGHSRIGGHAHHLPTSPGSHRSRTSADFESWGSGKQPGLVRLCLQRCRLRGGFARESSLAVEEEPTRSDVHPIVKQGEIAGQRGLEQEIAVLQSRLDEANHMLEKDSTYMHELRAQYEEEKGAFVAKIDELETELEYLRKMHNISTEAREASEGIESFGAKLQDLDLSAPNQRWMAEQLGRVDNQVRRLQAENSVLKNKDASRRAAHQVASKRQKAQLESYLQGLLMAREVLKVSVKDDATREELEKARMESLTAIEDAIFGEQASKLDYTKWEDLSVSDEEDVNVPEPPPPGFLERYLADSKIGAQ